MATRAKHRVLVVDDDDSNRRFAERALAMEGYEVVSAPSGPAALALLETEPPFDLFVIDILMPQMAGDVLGLEIAQRIPDARILYFTGYPERIIDRGLSPNEVLVEKPATLNRLLEAVSAALS